MINVCGRPSVIDSVILNPVQKEAVLYDGGPQLVFAGAGTGKTRVLTAKIAFLIQQKGLSPANIFAATFTNKAAREMQRRVEDLTGFPCRGLWIGTFHSLCARILRREARHLGYEAGFSIYDDDDQISCVKKIVKELSIDERTMPPRLLLSAISQYKNNCVAPQELSQNQGGFFEQQVIRVYAAYQQGLLRQQAMDFDDLITNCVYLFRRHEEVLAFYRRIFAFVLVDEYQDTNRAQFYLVKLLASGHNNVFVVGDDDQSIYAWRGAQVDNILSFEKVFPGTKVFTLEQNYRSTGAILNFANAVISHNALRAKKRLWTGKSGGGGVCVMRYRDDRHEAETVADRIGRYAAEGVRPCDIAVLYRTNAQSRLFEDSMRKRRIPYVLAGGISFYERREIKDCLAYLRLCVNPSDDLSCDRILNVPPRGIGDKSKEALARRAREAGTSIFSLITGGEAEGIIGRNAKGIAEVKELFQLLSELRKENASPYEMLRQVLALSDYLTMFEGEGDEEGEARIDNVNELVNAVSVWTNENPGRGLADFLEEISLASDVDRWEKKEECLNLMTLHCAKGLEFSTVFIVGCEDGILPSRQNCDDPVKLEEERRLFYVGITRARDGLECSYADQRMRFGNLIPMTATRFLSAVPPDAYTSIDLGGSFVRQELPQKRVPAADRPAADRQHRPYREEDFSQDTVEYRVGQHVLHKVYGKGRIVNLSGFGDDLRMTVLFNDGARRKLMAKFADFETV
jgi:DNA helicase II / ATP-dependent DNA helicase PcrA